MKIFKLTSLSFILVFTLLNCSVPTDKEEELVFVHDSEKIQNEMTELGEAFRAASRLKYINGRNQLNVNPENIETEMLNHLSNQYPENELYSDYNSFTSSEPIQNLNNSVRTIEGDFDPGSSDVPTLQDLNLEYEIALLESMLDQINISSKHKFYIKQLNSKILNLSKNKINSINNNSQLINGDYYVNEVNFDDDEYLSELKNEILFVEDIIIHDFSLNNYEKQTLLDYTTAMYYNVNHIIEFSKTFSPDELISLVPNNRGVNFFKKVKSLFKRVGSAVLTIVTTGLSISAGIAMGAFAGGIPGAIVGGIVGFTVGIEMSFYVSCENGWVGCQDCQDAYPNANITC